MAINLMEHSLRKGQGIWKIEEGEIQKYSVEEVNNYVAKCRINGEFFRINLKNNEDVFLNASEARQELLKRRSEL